jgi:hypothetical protein
VAGEGAARLVEETVSAEAEASGASRAPGAAEPDEDGVGAVDDTVSAGAATGNGCGGDDGPAAESWECPGAAGSAGRRNTVAAPPNTASNAIATPPPKRRRRATLRLVVVTSAIDAFSDADGWPSPRLPDESVSANAAGSEMRALMGVWPSTTASASICSVAEANRSSGLRLHARWNHSSNAGPKGEPR